MGLLNRLSSDRSQKPQLELTRLDRLDPFLGDTELRNAYFALVAGDWKKLERFLAVSPKSWMFRPIATSPIVGLETVSFERWVEFKHSPRARTFYAGIMIRDADEARAAAIDEASGDDERRAEDDKHAARLEAAEEILYEVVATRPALADPWVVLLISGRGLGVSLEELRERFENAHSRAPFRPDACREYLEGLTKKHGGSNIATFDFARWIESEASETSPARAALPIAHIERGLFAEGKAELATYLKRPDVVAELANGLHDFLRASPSPAPTEVLGVLNAYALAISTDSQSTGRLVTETFARIDHRPTEYPWSIYSDDITEVFSEIQADQLRFSSRF